MVTRVDKKPLMHGTTMARILKAPVQNESRELVKEILRKAVGYKTPTVSVEQLIEDVDDLDLAFQMMGVDDRLYEYWASAEDEGDNESLELARLIVNRTTSMYAIMKNRNLMESLAKALGHLVADVDAIYTGTEAVYQFLNFAYKDYVFSSYERPDYTTWAVETAKRTMITQSAYMLINPRATQDMALGMASDMTFDIWSAWTLYKKVETLALRMGSKKGLLAHAYHAGYTRRAFDSDPQILPDFEVPLTGFAACKKACKLYIMGGVRYFKIGAFLLCLTHDDSVNLATMAQCYYRTALYFTQSNGYKRDNVNRALSIVKDITEHACRLINNGKSFSHIIRSLHILAQGDFNDAYEDTHGTDFGWVVRSANYRKEARELDPMGDVFHKRTLLLASDKMDRLNVGFIYHAFVGDEMLPSDLDSKVKNMAGKVLNADPTEWKRFIAFCKAYLLARYMKTYKRKPRCAGATEILSQPWADRCVRGTFTMPAQSDWGKVWIDREFSWTTHADHWHLDAQDVAYVPKDSAGILAGNYRGDAISNSELLMAMTGGNVLNLLTGSTPASARQRILDNEPTEEVVLTTAPKAENAKPSWKKRVTFAADCEFRKMQAEYDRNCRKIMNFVRGPSLGLDVCTLERQFAQISNATAQGSVGAVCSHDISAWSESMDRARKFEFEQILVNMLAKPDMINIKSDWDKIKGTVLKGGKKECYPIDNASFQGFDGSTSTLLHAMILIYCIDTARRKSIMPTYVKANMATLIDDCVALMVGLDNATNAVDFWAHLNTTYRSLGFEIDNLKSIFSTIKAIYLSRRFVIGGEVPSDFKVFVKAHVSYEDPLRCSTDVITDIFGAARGACDSNGDAWYIYFTSLVHCYSELAHANPVITTIPATAAAIYALAPVVENGWGVPSIISWATNDIVDNRTHFNSIMESLCEHAMSSEALQAGVDTFPRPAQNALYTIKAQAWRLVSFSSIFTNPFEAIREGPLKPDMLRRNAVSDLLSTIATAEPWKSLLAWNSSATTTIIRELLIDSGPLHAPTLAALVNCMPDNYRLGLLGKAIGSTSVLNRLPKAGRTLLKRRVMRCAAHYFKYTASLYSSTNELYTPQDFACIDHTERTIAEREEFFACNGVVMTDHTFPDPIGTFTHSSENLGSVISPNKASLRFWDPEVVRVNRVSQLISVKGMYVPKRSGRVWEITSEYAKGWDTISQRIAMGLAILARARADGHEVDGLLAYFTKAWNEASNITPEDTHLISIHGSIKRLDANPGSSSHPIIISRNLLSGFNNKIKTAIDAIRMRAKEVTGNESNLHDPLAHETCMLAATALHFIAYQYLGCADGGLYFNIATRASAVIPESTLRMKTDKVANRINNEIIDSHTPYGLLQSCPELSGSISIPTMKNSWVKMINSLLDGKYADCEDLMKEANKNQGIPEDGEDEVYGPYVVLAEAPAARHSIPYSAYTKYAIHASEPSHRSEGDAYTIAVPSLGSKYSRAVSSDQPWYIISAVGIKSVVWNRLKERSPLALAKILYDDSDADLGVLSHCASRDFWRGVIAEASRGRGNRMLSDVIMSGFRSLGVPDIHISATNDLITASQSVASYFGAHLKSIPKLVSTEILSLAGRNARDFERPLLERIVTNNPALANATFRKKHIKTLIETNLEMISMRIRAIKTGKITHFGDKRAFNISISARLVELKCRAHVYSCTKINEDGSVLIIEKDLGTIVATKAKDVLTKCRVSINCAPGNPNTADEIFCYMEAIEAVLLAARKLGVSGWDARSGILGVRYAMDTIYSDSLKLSQTRFAVSASELAPRVFKRVRASHAAEPTIRSANINIGASFIHDDDDDDDDLMGIEEFTRFQPVVRFDINIPGWQALYTLILTGIITPSDVNETLGTEIPEVISCMSLREAHLEDFDDGTLYAKFPLLKTEYARSGTIFNPDWLDRDEADAYMVDETITGPGGYLL